MFLPTIHSEDDEFRHAVARVEWPAASLAGNGDAARSRFLEYFSFASPLWMQLPVLSASMRIDVSPDRAPVTWHGFTVAKRNGDLARQTVAALLRLDGVEGASVTCPGDIGDFSDAFAGTDDEWWCPDTEPSTTAAGAAFFDTGRIYDRLAALLTSGVTLGFALRYQATFKRGRPHADLVRGARKAVAALERHPNVPRRLVETQSRLVDRVQEAGYSAEEAVAVSAEGRDWLLQWLDSNLAVAPGTGTQHQRAVAVEGERAEALAHHVHPEVVMGEILAPDDLARVPQYWNDGEVAALFRCDSLWRPGVRLDGPPPVSPLPMFFRAPDAPRPPPASGAAGSGASDSFYFVSYAHKDIGLIKPILARIEGGGNRIWIDDQINVGEEWDTRLERMITTSSGLLVFLSPNYVASKHCRRELKFADALDKAIYACALSEFPRQEGFGYIFASLQYAIGTQDQIAEKLIAGLNGRP